MRSVSLWILVGASFVPPIARAQQLTATEWSLGATTVVARQTLAGAELGLAHRSGGEMRFALAAAGGVLADRAAARAQATVQLLVNSAARAGGGPGLYAALGAACTARRGSRGQAFLAVMLGLEATPGARRGWYVELGFAGGARLAAGLRLRRFPKWWGTGTR